MDELYQGHPSPQHARQFDRLNCNGRRANGKCVELSRRFAYTMRIVERVLIANQNSEPKENTQITRTRTSEYVH